MQHFNERLDVSPICGLAGTSAPSHNRVAKHHAASTTVVHTNRVCHSDVDVGQVCDSFLCELRNVILHMPATRQEVWRHYNVRCTLLHASVDRLLDARLCQLHVRHFHNLVFAPRLEHLSELSEHLVGLGFLAAVIDNHNADDGVRFCLRLRLCIACIAAAGK